MKLVLVGMKIAIDFHIHTTLSPCADLDMTPNNIVNMVLLKGLDAISITDHNACDNVEAVIKAAASRFLVLPGMELQTREEVHILCYFPSVEAMMDFDEVIRKYMPKMHRGAKMVGDQQIMDENDLIIGVRNEPLISSVDISLEKALNEVRNRGGVAVPAHIDRTAYGIIAQLGFIPPKANFSVLEISRNNRNKMLHHEDNSIEMKWYALENIGKQNFISRFPELYIFSSDAHSLGEILEREMFLEVDELSINAILCKLKGECFP